ncbi:MAG TPA: Ig-like domain-containing protein [Tepidisphaeraceae bacterium]
MSPNNLGIGVGVNTHVGVTFASSMQQASLTSSTLQLLDNNTPVASRISYNANSFTATIDSNSPLAYGHTYNVKVVGGASGVLDSSSGTLASNYTFSFTTAPDPNSGPGGPILVITRSANPYTNYYAEILRAEGLNEFATARLSTVTAATLQNYKAVILGEGTLTAAQATMLTDWVTNDGGKLIAMRPDAQLASLLGLTATGATINDTYVSVDTSTTIGGGITSDSMQYHGTADRYTLNGATKLADLFSNSTTAIGNPAISIRNVGSNGGQAAAFTYDLAKSIIQTRQGNPAWSGQERDGQTPIRSDDLFYGGTPSTDWVDLTKVQIPQADEQQRLLANMINQMTATTMPLPRFWYFPNGKKSMVIMTGDDHNYGGTAFRWSDYLSSGNADGLPIRGSSYMYPGVGSITDLTAAFYQALGFDPAVHIEVADANDQPRNWTDYNDLDAVYTSEINAFNAKYTSIPTPSTNRTHAIVWSDYDSQPQVEFAHRMRLDTTYYYWPSSWVANRPGMFTGSGLPMRFAKMDGTLIDVYQATTQITDENGGTEPYHINTLLDNATGSKGYYGAFTINAHTDLPNSTLSDYVIASAKAHDIPVITAPALMNWTDGRNGSSFSNHAWNAGTGALTFNITMAVGATGLQAMVPLVGGNNKNVSAISVNGSAVSYTVQKIKGVDYAFFAASAGAVSVSYAGDMTAPTVTDKSPGATATNISITAKPTVTFSEDVNPATATFTLSDALSQTVAGAVTYSAGTRTFTFAPSSPLNVGATYTLKMTGAQDLAGNAMAGTTTWTFTTAGNGPFTIWDNNVSPQFVHVTDSPIVVGMKFKADYDGYISGVRFWKDAQNTGSHEGVLYTSTGSVLAIGTFQNETASGWQTLTFSSPIAITAGTTYVAGYRTDTGYSADPSYFDRQYDSRYLHVLADVASGGNGLYRYTNVMLFPNQSFHATNYWVDVIYNVGAVDTTPPTVAPTSPASAATNVAVNSNITATFNEAVQQGTINFTLKDAANNNVPGTVSYNSSTNVATFTPASALSGSTTYTATITGAKDLSGNTMAGSTSWSFSTAAVDTTPPAVTGTSPVNGATNVSPSSVMTATFSEAVQQNTISFVVKDGANNSVAGTITYDAGTKTATFTPTNPLNQSTTYTATVSGAKDVAGNTMSAATNWSFTTADLTPPTVTARTPANGANNVAVGSTVTATFSEAVQQNTIAFVLKDAGNNVVAGTVAYDALTKTATFTPSAALSELASYTATVSGAQDLSGNAMTAGATWSFSTGDFTAPTVTVRAPSSGAGNVPVGSTITATFSESVQQNSILFVLKDAGNNAVPGTIAYDAGTKTATFTPSAPLSESTTYTATVSGAQDAAGNAMGAASTWSFTTGDFTAPTVTGTSPASGAATVALGATISATFSEAVQQNTISLVVKDAGNNTIAGSVAYDVNTKTVTFTPTAALSGSTTYTVTISGAADLAGNTIVAPYNWSFTTADVTAPTVTATTPLNGASNVSVGSVITATFSEAVQVNTIVFTLKDSQNNTVAGSGVYDAATRTYTFTPANPLGEIETYTASIGAQDLAGNAMAAAQAWSFATADATAPLPSGGSETPNAGASSFDFTVTYTDAGSGVDASTFDNNDITVTGPSGFSANATFISADVAGNGATRVVTYRISAPGGTWNVADSGAYTISLNAGQVKDVAGNGIAAGAVRTLSPVIPFAYQSGSTVFVEFYGSIPGVTLSAGAGDLAASDGATTLSFTGVTSVQVMGTANNDVLNLNGPITPAVSFALGAGSNTVNFNGGAYTLNADAGLSNTNLTINLNAGTLTFNASQHVAALNIADNATAVFSADGNRSLRTGTLSISNLGTLDLNDNDFVVSNGNFQQIFNWLFQGYRVEPEENLHGIVSTVGQHTGGATIHALFDNGLVGATDFPFASGQTIPAGAICGKYTFLGDADLNGAVTPDDYLSIDSNLGQNVAPGDGWFKGDYNFDGTITPDDYIAIDSNLGRGENNPLAATEPGPIVVQMPLSQLMMQGRVAEELGL